MSSDDELGSLLTRRTASALYEEIGELRLRLGAARNGLRAAINYMNDPTHTPWGTDHDETLRIMEQSMELSEPLRRARTPRDEHDAPH
jgi:hypothetical protein